MAARFLIHGQDRLDEVEVVLPLRCVEAPFGGEFMMVKVIYIDAPTDGVGWDWICDTAEPLNREAAELQKISRLANKILGAQ